MFAPPLRPAAAPSVNPCSSPGGGSGFLPPPHPRQPGPLPLPVSRRRLGASGLQRPWPECPWGRGCGQKGARQLEEAGIPRVVGRGRLPAARVLPWPWRGPSLPRHAVRVYRRQHHATSQPPRTRGGSGQSRLSALDDVLAPRPWEPPPHLRLPASIRYFLVSRTARTEPGHRHLRDEPHGTTRWGAEARAADSQNS